MLLDSITIAQGGGGEGEEGSHVIRGFTGIVGHTINVTGHMRLGAY